MAETFGIGIVGAGTIGAVHAGAIGALDDARVVAVAEPREDAGRALAAEHGAAWHADYDDLLARSDVDLVVLATPSGLHADQAVRAAGAGKHVISEKPMATTLDGADRMIAACQEAGVTLAVIFQNRFTPAALRLKRAVEAGLFGQPVFGNAFVHWFRSPEYYAEKGGWRGTWALDGGGALMNQSIHTIDLLQWTLGPLESLSAYTATLARPIEAEDAASAALRFTGGALGAIQGATAAHKSFPVRLDIVGTEGSATLAGSKLTHWQPAREPAGDLLTPADHALADGWEEGEGFGAGHTRQLRAIFAALRDGTEVPVPGAEARKAVEIILAIYQSARNGRRITFPLTEGAETARNA